MERATPERKADGAKRGGKRRESGGVNPEPAGPSDRAPPATEEEVEVAGSPKSRKKIVVDTDKAPGAPRKPQVTRSMTHTLGGDTSRRLFED